MKSDNKYKIAIIVPVKDNQVGINRLLESFFENTEECIHQRVIIVDNNSNIPIYIPEQYARQDLSIDLVKCARQGAGFAKNVGAEFVSKSYQCEWILFVYSDCIFTNTTISNYIKILNNNNTRDIVGYQGLIKALGDDWLSKYYDESNNFIPAKIRKENSEDQPAYLVCANALISLKAFLKINGFAAEYLFAAEDIDLAYRLLKEGKIIFANDCCLKYDYLNGDNEIKGKHIVNLILHYRKYGWAEGILLENYSKTCDDYLSEYDKLYSLPISELSEAAIRIICCSALAEGQRDYANKRSPISEKLYTFKASIKQEQ